MDGVESPSFPTPKGQGTEESYAGAGRHPITCPRPRSMLRRYSTDQAGGAAGKTIQYPTAREGGTCAECGILPLGRSTAASEERDARHLAGGRPTTALCSTTRYSRHKG